MLKYVYHLYFYYLKTRPPLYLASRWFVDEYMVTNETLLHKNPKTGKPQAIGLGWLDDSMTPTVRMNQKQENTDNSILNCV